MIGPVRFHQIDADLELRHGSVPEEILDEAQLGDFGTQFSSFDRDVINYGRITFTNS